MEIDKYTLLYLNLLFEVLSLWIVKTSRKLLLNLILNEKKC